MKKNLLKKIINIIREQSVAAPPTNNVGSGHIAGTSEAGDDPPVRKKKKYIYGGRGSRKQWMVKKSES
mgnify:CR=1 FL=1